MTESATQTPQLVDPHTEPSDIHDDDAMLTQEALEEPHELPSSSGFHEMSPTSQQTHTSRTSNEQFGNSVCVGAVAVSQTQTSGQASSGHATTMVAIISAPKNIRSKQLKMNKPMGPQHMKMPPKSGKPRQFGFSSGRNLKDMSRAGTLSGVGSSQELMDEMNQTQLREHLESSQMSLHEVGGATLSHNKLVVLIEHGSDRASSAGDQQYHPRLPAKQYKLKADGTQDKGTEPMPNVDHLNSCNSSGGQSNKAPSPKYNLQRPSVVIESQPASLQNVDLPTTANLQLQQNQGNSPQLRAAFSFANMVQSKSKSRMPARELQTSKISVEAVLIGSELQSPQFKGSKRNKSQHEKVLAIRGIEKSPNSSKVQLIDASQQFAITNTYKRSKPAVNDDSRQHSAKKHGNQLGASPFTNIVSGTSLKIDANAPGKMLGSYSTPEIGDLGHMNSRNQLMVHQSINKDTINLDESVMATENDMHVQTQRLIGFSLQKALEPEPTIDNSGVVVLGIMNQTSQSTGVDGGFKDLQSKKRRKSKRRDQARRTNVSKDLIDIISDQSAEDSDINEANGSKGERSIQKKPPLPPDKKHDTSITFFKEKEIQGALQVNVGANKKRYGDNLNATVSTFHVTKNSIKPLVAQLKDKKQSPSPKRYFSKRQDPKSPPPKVEKVEQEFETPHVLSPIAGPAIPYIPKSPKDGLLYAPNFNQLEQIAHQQSASKLKHHLGQQQPIMGVLDGNKLLQGIANAQPANLLHKSPSSRLKIHQKQTKPSALQQQSHNPKDITKFQALTHNYQVMPTQLLTMEKVDEASRRMIAIKPSKKEEKITTTVLLRSNQFPSSHIPDSNTTSPPGEWAHTPTEERSPSSRRKLTVQMEQGRMQPKRINHLVSRKTTKGLSTSFNATDTITQSKRAAPSQAGYAHSTIQKVMELHDTLNQASIDPIEDMKMLGENKSGGLTMINARHHESIQDSLYLPASTNRKGQVDFGEVSLGTETPNLDDKLTLDQRESPMVRYIDGPPAISGSNVSAGDLLITNMTNVPSNQNLVANATLTSINTTMLGGRREYGRKHPIQPNIKTSSQLVPLQQHINTQLNSSNATNPVTHHYPQVADAKAKYCMSVLSQPQLTNQKQNVKVNIDLRGGGNPPNAQITQNSIKQKMTMAERIREVKESQQRSVLLPVQQRSKILSQRSRSINPRSKHNAFISDISETSSPLYMGSIPNSLRSSRHGSFASNQIDLVKRFKNISEREVIPGHISDKVYFAAQNQSQYNNIYSFVGRSTTDSPPLVANQVQIKYQQRKLSHLERPTQLEIGGEGSPMLSLLPPLKTREISPRFNSSFGKQLKGQHQQLQQAKQARSKSRTQMKDEPLYQNTKFILPERDQLPVSTLDDPVVQQPNSGVNQIFSNPVMIKTISKQPFKLSTQMPQEQPDSIVEEVEVKDSDGEELTKSVKSDDQQENSFDHQEFSLDEGQRQIETKHQASDDENFDEKLAQMASLMHRDVVVPLHYRWDNDPVTYERRQRNIDGSWKEQQKYRPCQPGFHFLEYAAQNFKNPLQMVQDAAAKQRTGGPPPQQAGWNAMNLISSKNHSMAVLDLMGDNSAKEAALKLALATQISVKSDKKTRQKRIHHSQAYNVDEKFSLKVQKKPINNALRTMKVQQADGPHGNKLYQIQVQQRSPMVRRRGSVKDSIDAVQSIKRRESMNETKNGPDGFGDVSILHQHIQKSESKKVVSKLQGGILTASELQKLNDDQGSRLIVQKKSEMILVSGKIANGDL